MRSAKWIAPVGIASLCVLVLMTWWDEEFEDSAADSYIADLSNPPDADPAAQRNSSAAQSTLNDLRPDAARSDSARPELTTEAHSSATGAPKCASVAGAATQITNAAPAPNYEDPSVPIEVKTIDPAKDGCEAVARTLRAANFIFDVTSKQSVWYGGPASWHDAGRAPLNPLMLADRVCSGLQHFDETTKPEFELQAVTPNANATIFIGKQWVSDGHIVSALTESEYKNLTTVLLGREAQGVGNGANSSRERFDEAMAKNQYNRQAATETAQKQRDDVLRRAQQHPSGECSN